MVDFLNDKPEEVARRSFFKKAGFAGLGAAAATFLAGESSKLNAQSSAAASVAAFPPDSPVNILTAALVAEDLATVFYYTGLTTPAVMQDPAIAGNPGNAAYLQAALYQEIQHANFLRGLLASLGVLTTAPGGATDSSLDPYQTFYFPTDTFSSLTSFLATLDTLENVFVGAYLTAVQELSQIAIADSDVVISGIARVQHPYFAKVAASIGAVEAEHRVLGRVISNTNPANDKAFEQTAGLTGVYYGATNAVNIIATNFLTPSVGSAYPLATAVAGAPSVWIAPSDPTAAGNQLPDSTIG